MRNLGLIFLLVMSGFGSLFAETVQVPESCLNRVNPCLLRVEGENLNFEQAGYKIQVLKDGILKINMDSERFNIDVVEGRLQIRKSTKEALQLSINGVDFKDKQLYVSQYAKKLVVLSRDSFNKSEYSIKANGEVIKESAILITKKELIELTRFYFDDLMQFKKFLSQIEPDWKAAFGRETDKQTKVLLRSIASSDEQAEAEAQKKRSEAQKLKKVRDEFFYRTFER